MRRSWTQVIIGLFVLIFLAQTADAQQWRRRQPVRHKKVRIASSIGIHGGNDFKNDQFLAGGQLWMPLGIFWKFAPSADYYFTQNDTTRWQFNGDFIFKPRINGLFYFGAGVATQYLNEKSMDTQWDFGGNLLVGIDFSGLRVPSMYPYLQARWTIIDKQTTFSLLGGVNLILR
ncbi:MAG: hypothetical protein GXO74_02735 [Calditrichaeota bacterium]|nr:hypothetical protein [Calditrichota bacterium]